MFSFGSISRDYLSWQASCQVFVDRPAQFSSPISHSVNSDIQSNSTDLICHTALLLLIFIAFRVLGSSVNYDRSKRVIKVGGFDCSKFWEGKHVNISISSKKIAVVRPGDRLQGHVVDIRTQMFSIFLISMDYICLQAPCSFSSIDPRGLDN
jgi:hypothetical protein